MSIEHKIFEFAFSLLSEMSLMGKIFSLIIIAICAFFVYSLRNKEFRLLIIQSVSKMLNIINDKETLSNSFFYKKSFYENCINSLQFDVPIKTELFKILLKTKTNIVIKETEKWLTGIDVKNINKHRLSNEFHINIHTIIKMYEEEILCAYKQRYGNKSGVHLFNYVYHSENGFKASHETNVKHIIKNIEVIINSNISNILKVEFYLKQLEVALDLAVLDCENTFRKFNGKLIEIYDNKSEK